MIFNLTAGIPMLIGHYDGVVVINVKQYGTGNLRLGTDKENLLNGLNAAPGQIVDGIPQASADGVKPYFWSGDLWIISDVSGPAMVMAPAYQTYIQRFTNAQIPADVPMDSEDEGNLSTYQYKGGFKQ